MHELSFAQQILDSVLLETDVYPGCSILRVKLRAGEALSLEPANLRFCLEAIAVGTPMDGAVVDIGEAGPELDCPQCGRVPVDSPLAAACPVCGRAGKPVPGTELIIEEIVLNEQDPET